METIFKHTKEELSEILLKVEKIHELNSLLTRVKDDFLNCYLNVLSAEIKIETDKYNYLLGRKIHGHTNSERFSNWEFTITEICEFSRSGITILANREDGYIFQCTNFEDLLIPLK